MKSRHLTTAGLGLIAALTFAVAACGDTADKPADTKGGNTGAGTQDASTALSQAAGELGKTSFKVAGKIGADGDLTGVMDPVKKHGNFTMNISAEGSKMTVETLMIGTDTYLKIKMPGSPIPGMDGKKWMHMQAGKKTGPMTVGQFDAAKVAKTLEHAATVERVGDKGFKGTLDLTKAADGLGVTAKDVSGLGDKAKAVPFEATVDDKGRLTRYKVDTPAMGTTPAQPIDITYSDFGTTVEVKAPPAGEVMETPGS